MKKSVRKRLLTKAKLLRDVIDYTPEPNRNDELALEVFVFTTMEFSGDNVEDFRLYEKSLFKRLASAKWPKYRRSF